jgi:hypothetical protein
LYNEAKANNRVDIMNYFYAENGFDMVNRRRRGNTMTERRMTSNYVPTFYTWKSISL